MNRLDEYIIIGPRHIFLKGELHSPIINFGKVYLQESSGIISAKRGIFSLFNNWSENKVASFIATLNSDVANQLKEKSTLKQKSEPDMRRVLELINGIRYDVRDGTEVKPGRDDNGVRVYEFMKSSDSYMDTLILDLTEKALYVLNFGIKTRVQYKGDPLPDWRLEHHTINDHHSEEGVIIKQFILLNFWLYYCPITHLVHLINQADYSFKE